MHVGSVKSLKKNTELLEGLTLFGKTTFEIFNISENIITSVEVTKVARSSQAESQRTW
jgi:hypothetical protein